MFSLSIQHANSQTLNQCSVWVYFTSLKDSKLALSCFQTVMQLSAPAGNMAMNLGFGFFVRMYCSDKNEIF